MFDKEKTEKEKRRRYNLKYQKENSEKIRLQKRDYYQRNKKEIYKKRKAYAKEYYLRNKYEISKNHHRYYLKNKEIINQKHKEYRSNNRQKEKIRHRKYGLSNVEKIKIRVKEYQRKNRKIISLKAKEYYHRNPKYRRSQLEYQKIKRLKDLNFNISSRLRRRVRGAFTKYSKTGKIASAKEYGIDYAKIINHLKPFPNSISKYEIDHIIPLCRFDLTDPSQIEKAFAPENHQWLLISDNRKKKDKILI